VDNTSCVANSLLNPSPLYLAYPISTLLCATPNLYNIPLNTALVLCYRDVVEVRLELAGVPCIVSDTAGLRADSSDVIELEGMRRARWAAWLGLSWVLVTWCGLYWFVTAVFQTSGVVRWGEKAPRVCYCLKRNGQPCCCREAFERAQIKLFVVDSSDDRAVQVRIR
jgi:hypothetical protein